MDIGRRFHHKIIEREIDVRNNERFFALAQKCATSLEIVKRNRKQTADSQAVFENRRLLVNIDVTIFNSDFCDTERLEIFIAEEFCHTRLFAMSGGIVETFGFNLRFHYKHRSHIENLRVIRLFDVDILDIKFWHRDIHTAVGRILSIVERTNADFARRNSLLLG